MSSTKPESTPFARAIGVLMDERGWSQRAIARAMGLSHPQVRAYIDGEQEPGFFKVVALAEAAGVSLDWLAGRELRQPQVDVDGVRYVPSKSEHENDVIANVSKKFRGSPGPRGGPQRRD